jgi:hypothetical protein
MTGTEPRALRVADVVGIVAAKHGVIGAHGIDDELIAGRTQAQVS